jgi:hypothetical protein
LACTPEQMTAACSAFVDSSVYIELRVVALNRGFLGVFWINAIALLETSQSYYTCRTMANEFGTFLASITPRSLNTVNQTCGNWEQNQQPDHTARKSRKSSNAKASKHIDKNSDSESNEKNVSQCLSFRRRRWTHGLIPIKIKTL